MAATAEAAESPDTSVPQGTLEADTGQPPTKAVCAAFALGWQMAELFADGYPEAAAGAAARADSNGAPDANGNARASVELPDLSHDQTIDLRFAQIAHGLHRVAEFSAGRSDDRDARRRFAGRAEA